MVWPLGVAVTDLFGRLHTDNIATIAACRGAVNARPSASNQRIITGQPRPCQRSFGCILVSL